MADDRIPQATSEVLEPSGKRFTVPWFRFFAALDGILATIADGAATALQIASNLSDVADAATSFANIKQPASGTTTGVVQQTQVDAYGDFHPELEGGYVNVWLEAPYDLTVTRVVTQSASGTATCLLDCNGTNPDGGSNAVSSTKQTKNHTDDNVVPQGGYLRYLVSSASSCVGASVEIHYTYDLNA